MHDAADASVKVGGCLVDCGEARYSTASILNLNTAQCLQVLWHALRGNLYQDQQASQGLESADCPSASGLICCL